MRRLRRWAALPFMLVCLLTGGLAWACFQLAERVEGTE